MEYYPVITRDEVLIDASRNPENIVLSAIGQPQKDKYQMTHFYEVSRRGEFIQKEVD